MISSSLVIQNARILLPNGDFFSGEVQVQDGQIAQVGVDLAPLDDRAIVIDATG